MTYPDEVRRRWPEPCENAFRYMRDHYPSELLDLIQNGGLEDHDLTFAAERAGQISSMPDKVKATLLPLLKHPSAVVREGALYGISSFVRQDKEVWDAVFELITRDESEAVRTVAYDLTRHPD